MRSILVTGAAGFIGSNFVKYWQEKYNSDKIVLLDALTYAGNIRSLEELIEQKKVIFVRGNICDETLVRKIFTTHSIDTVVNFAAESHVDRSINAPDAFVNTNILGTHVLLCAAKNYWNGDFKNKRFHHISTDEVYGDLGPQDPAFTEQTPYGPRSPYAATKASSDHLVRSSNITYGMPTTITNCSNNYGPFHFPEKLIPLVITNALDGKNLPIYGSGNNVRDWLFVVDHCRAVEAVLDKGKVGATYNVGGDTEISNIDLVRMICRQLDLKLSQSSSLQKQFPKCSVANGRTSEDLIEFVKDRPGHDRRYAVNSNKIAKELGFEPTVSFTTGIEVTLDWYLENEAWWRQVQSGEHLEWVQQHYAS